MKEEKEEWIKEKRKEIKEDKDEKESMIKKTLDLISQHRTRSGNEAFLKWVGEIWQRREDICALLFYSSFIVISSFFVTFFLFSIFNLLTNFFGSFKLLCCF